CDARSRMAISSAFCSAVLSPFLEGQSMFATVAIHAPRNSRNGRGGVAAGSEAVAGQASAFRNNAINGPRVMCIWINTNRLEVNPFLGRLAKPFRRHTLW